MNVGPSPPTEDANTEILALIKTLHETGQRLEALTAGEVDTVLHADGSTSLLPHSLEQFRSSKAAKQAAILNALPANIALLDAQGIILAVNEGWKQFALANALQTPAFGVGVDYLSICDRALGAGASEAHQAAAGIRSVLEGQAKSFSLEYPCHSPSEQRWFYLIVTPLQGDPPNGVVVMQLNITERKMTEVNLQDSESRFRQMAEASNEVFYLQEIATAQIFYVSPAFERIWGVPLERVYEDPMTWAYATHPDDREYAYQKYNEGRSLGYDYEFRIIRPDGEIRWIHTRAVPILDPSGAPYRIAGLASDITQRRNADEALKESDLKFRQMAENIQDAFFLLEADGRRMLYVSPAFERIWGRTREGLYAKPESWLDAVHPEDRTATLEAYAQGLLTGNARFEFRVVRPDGSIRWVEVRAFPVLGDDGQIVRITGIAQDITIHKRDDQKFKDLLDAAPDAMALVDQTGAMVLVNAAAIRLFGWRRDELLGEKIQKLVPAYQQRTHLENLGGSFSQPRAGAIGKGFELSGRRKDGTEFPVEIALSLLELEGDPLLIAAVRDITERKQAAVLLRESQRRFRDMLDNVELISLMLDREARITYCNDYLLRLTGWQREEILGKDWFELFIAPALHHLKDSFYQEILADRPVARHDENEILTQSGERRLIRWNNSVLRSGDGAITGIASIGEDITERREARDRILYLSRVYAVLSGINSVIVRVNDRDELLREVCRIAVEEGGFRMAMIAMVDPDLKLVVPVATAGKDEALMTAIVGLLSSTETAPKTMTARAMQERTAVVSNDSQNDPQVLVRAHYAAAGVCSMAVFPVIVAGEAVGVLALYAKEVGFFHEEELDLLTELTGDLAFAIDHIEKQSRLNYLAYYDVLTGLANRTLFLERVAQYQRSAAAGGHKLALFLVDLERFKDLNDSLGRQVGDELLRQVAAWLTRMTGDANLVGRMGADVFALVLPDVAEGGNLVRMVEKGLESFMLHPFHLNGSVFRVAARVGVAIYPEDGADAETLFKHAEAALKRAKARGERYLFFTRTMTEAVASRLTLENQLRRAMDNGEFVLHYQPKVNLASGLVTSAEALIRWNDPRTGLVPPGKFIPILEETGMIHDVGRWAVRRAIEDYLNWRNSGLAAVRIAVNVSPLQLRNSGFIAEVKEALGADDRAPDGLELEITESLIMENVKHTIASLQGIRSLGVCVAIDDFGTGFSSLSYLSRLPVDTLKIDRSFVIDMTEGPEGLSLVSTIINLAHSLKLKVVAEGVETEEQSRLLRLLNCDEMQGYLFSKPVPKEIFETKFLARPHLES